MFLILAFRILNSYKVDKCESHPLCWLLVTRSINITLFEDVVGVNAPFRAETTK